MRLKRKKDNRKKFNAPQLSEDERIKYNESRFITPDNMKEVSNSIWQEFEGTYKFRR